MNEVLDAILSWVEGVPPVWRVLVTGVAVLLETSILVGLVVPGDTIVLVSSTGVTTLAAYLFTVLAVVLGALAGESIGFSLGRLFGPRLRSSWLGRQVGEKRWAKADRFVQRRGGIAVFISRFLPVFHSVIPLTAGTTAMRYRSFMIWTIPAASSGLSSTCPSAQARPAHTVNCKRLFLRPGGSSSPLLPYQSCWWP